MRALVAALVLSLVFAASASAQVESWGSSIGGTEFQQPFPVLELASASAIQVSNSTDSAIVEGHEFLWKDGEAGQLGNGAFADSETPVEATFPAGTVIVAVGEARNTEYAIDSTGQLWSWGEGLSGSLCQGKGVKDVGVPTKVSGITSAVQVEGAGQHVDILLANGTVDECGGIFKKEADATPTPLGFSEIVSITTASDIIGLRADGELFGEGLNEHGELCDGSAEEVGPTVVHIANEVTQASDGADVSKNGQLLYLSHGEMYACGADTEGQLGNDSTVSPVTSAVDTGLRFSRIVSGGYFGLGVREGEVYSWGGNAGDDLGDGHTGKKPQLAPVAVVEGSEVSATADNAESNG
jgi:alpha-tubulin suppressor-like RCC1 family protein